MYRSTAAPSHFESSIRVFSSFESMEDSQDTSARSIPEAVEGNTIEDLSMIPSSTPSVVPSDPSIVQSNVQPSTTSKPIASTGPPQKRARTQRATEEVEKQADSVQRSEAWQHFTKVKDSNPIKAVCNYCGQAYAADPIRNGTSNLINHLQLRCNKAPWSKEKGQSKMTIFLTPKDSGKAKSAIVDLNELRKSLAEMVITDELPFNFVEGNGFKKMMGIAEPRFKVPSRVTAARDCMKIYDEERKKLKKELMGRRVCLTTNTWTSLQNYNYMVLTVHYIDDNWVLQKKILNFCIIESHKGAMIASKLEDCLHDWGIDKILTLTVDNASSNDLCIQELLKDFKFKDVLLNNAFFHVRCHAHILNLVVKDGLKEHSSSIVRVRNACKYVRSSPARLKTFKQCAQKEKLDLSHSVILDVDTRWNSTYLMLDRAEKYETAFDRLRKHEKSFQDFFDCYDFPCEDDDNAIGRRKGKIIGPPKGDDWVVARNFVTFLQLFYNVTLKFSTTLDVTSNACVIELCKVKVLIEEMMCVGSSPSMFAMASSMSLKYDKYWSNWYNMNHLLFVAIVFDPRYKMSGLEVCLKIMFGSSESVIRKKDIEKHVNDLFSQKSLDPTLSDKVLNTIPSVDEKKPGVDSLGSFSFMSKYLGNKDINVNKNELSTYLNDGLEKGDEFNVLEWWKSNVLKYPILSSIAKDIFAIPVSTVASEQAFSTSGRVIDAYRSSLNPETVEALMCTQNWLNEIGTPVDIDMMKALDETEDYRAVPGESSGSCSKGGIQVDSD